MSTFFLFDSFAYVVYVMPFQTFVIPFYIIWFDSSLSYNLPSKKKKCTSSSKAFFFYVIHVQYCFYFSSDFVFRLQNIIPSTSSREFTLKILNINPYIVFKTYISDWLHVLLVPKLTLLFVG